MQDPCSYLAIGMVVGLITGMYLGFIIVGHEQPEQKRKRKKQLKKK